MSSKDYPFTSEEFDAIYSRVPRLTVEVIIRNGTGAVYLTKRSIEPCAGQWHLPGGTVFFGESLLEAVRRVAEREIGVKVLSATDKGYIEYPSHYRQGLDQPIGLVFEATSYEGEPMSNDEAQAADWFETLPSPMHADQDIFLLEHGYLKG